MPQQPPSNPPEKTDVGAVVVEHDLPCRTCGYNLRGLSPRGECPECRTPVHRALHGDLLRYSDPQWVRTVARGLRVLNSAIMIGILAGFVVMMLSRSPALKIALPVAVLAIGAVAALGLWLMTQREQAAAEGEHALSMRRTMRGLMIVALALEAYLDWFAKPSAGLWLPLRLAGGAVWIAAIALAFRYAKTLALRIPDPDLVAQTRGVMWGMIWSYGLAIMLIALALAGRQLTAVWTMAFGLSCTVMIACVIFALWSLGLIARYAVALKQAAEEADLTWTSNAAEETSEI